MSGLTYWREKVAAKQWDAEAIVRWANVERCPAADIAKAYGLEPYGLHVGCSAGCLWSFGSRFGASMTRGDWDEADRCLDRLEDLALELKQAKGTT